MYTEYLIYIVICKLIFILLDLMFSQLRKVHTHHLLLLSLKYKYYLFFTFHSFSLHSSFLIHINHTATDLLFYFIILHFNLNSLITLTN